MQDRCLPPTIDALVPRYLIICVDVLGNRVSDYVPNQHWSTLQRASVLSIRGHTENDDYSTIIAYINENQYDAVYLIGSVIPQPGVTCIDVVRSNTVVKHENIQQHFNRFQQVYDTFHRNCRTTITGLCEVDCKRGFQVASDLRRWQLEACCLCSVWLHVRIR